MLLDQIFLTHFRSYTKKSFTFSPSVTVIVGENTAGKTNVLEALYLLATGKSFRADTDREMIQLQEGVSHVICHESGTDDMMKLEVVLTHGEVNGVHAPLKKYLVNGIARRAVDFIGNFRAVLFWPEHLELVTASPSLRRRYLDSVLVQVDREYRRNLVSYERGLRQRNRLLDLINEGKASRGQLTFWNQLLIKSGAYLTDKRAEFINFVNAYPVSGVTYRIEYDKSVLSEARLDQYKEEEVAAKATLVGPHRDDIVFKKRQIEDNYVDLSKYGSRGEQRLAILWLKLAEVAFVHRQTGVRPTLLLDDIFSELDEGHRELVLEIVKEQQTIITSAETNVINLLRKAKGIKPMVIQL